MPSLFILDNTRRPTILPWMSNTLRVFCAISGTSRDETMVPQDTLLKYEDMHMSSDNKTELLRIFGAVQMFKFKYLLYGVFSS